MHETGTTIQPRAPFACNESLHLSQNISAATENGTKLKGMFIVIPQLRAAFKRGDADESLAENRAKYVGKEVSKTECFGSMHCVD